MTTFGLDGLEIEVDILKAALLKQWRGDGSHNEFTHGFHPRKAIMHPAAVSLMLQLLPGDGPILDPFVGAGTTALQVMLQGRLAIGGEVSPLAIGIARATCWLPSVEEIRELEKTALKIAASFDASEKPIDFKCGQAARNILQKHVSDVTQDVALALWFILDFEEKRRDLDWQNGNDRAKVKGAAERFLSTTRRYVSKITKLRAAVPSNTPPARLDLRDAREPVSTFLDGVLTSPPYPGVFDYTEENKNTVSESGAGDHLGLASFVTRSCKKINFALEIGSKRLAEKGRDSFSECWQSDTVAWLSACAAKLRQFGRIAILIGNHNGINALDSIRKAVPLCGGGEYKLRIVAAASVREEDRVRRPWGGKKRLYRAEHCILLVKEPFTSKEGYNPRVRLDGLLGS